MIRLVRLSIFTTRFVNLSNGCPKYKIANFELSDRIARSFSTARCFRTNRQYHGGERNRSTVYYVVALGVLVVGLSYAAVPLYRLFCQVNTKRVQVFNLFKFLCLDFSPTVMVVQQLLDTMLKVWKIWNPIENGSSRFVSMQTHHLVSRGTSSRSNLKSKYWMMLRNKSLEWQHRLSLGCPWGNCLGFLYCYK